MEHPKERLLLQGLVFAFAILLCGYLYFVSASVLNVMARQEASQRALSLQGEIGGLEQRYFTLSRTMTPETAHSLGLSALSATDYVYQPGTVGVVDIVRNAI